MSYKVTYNAPAVLTFVIVCFVLQVMNCVSQGYSNDFLAGNFFSYILLSGVLHVNWGHFFGNMLMILMVGPLLEEKYGSKRMLYLFVVTNLAVVVFGFLIHQVVIGASGIVFAMIFLSSLVNLHKKEVPLTFVLVAIIYLLQEVFASIGAVFAFDNIAHWGHIVGGFVGGALGFTSYFQQTKKELE